MRQEKLRPSRPTKIDSMSSQECDYAEVARILMSEDVFANTGRNAATLIQGAGQTVVVTVVRRGIALDEHVAGRPAHLVVLSGELEWHDPSRGAPVVLRTGHGVVFGARLPHRVVAREVCAFVLTLGRSERAGA